ncbi:hypothetical protein F5H01DRAFT_184424 [Linnemannia elongata]|nr:hypothetical protein F5H01DRAFT_184424 [Linnemannia elongata]
MPPKRKNSEIAVGDKQSPAKTAKTATTTAAGGAAKEKKNKPKPAKAEKVTKSQAKAAAADLEAKLNSIQSTLTSRRSFSQLSPFQKIFDPEKCYLWFKTYTGLEDDEDFDREQIGPVGIAKLCEDIDVSLETVDMLVLAYHLEADTMPIFTKDEWAKGSTRPRG